MGRWHGTWYNWGKMVDLRERIAAGTILARGVCRTLSHLGWVSVTEYTLPNNRRADVLALDSAGAIAIIEVKSSIEDFRADRKWLEYREFCDALYFAVPSDFPVDLIPESCGLILADAFSAVFVRTAPEIRLNPSRRKAVTLRFAQVAAQRLQRLIDPGAMLT